MSLSGIMTPVITPTDAHGHVAAGPFAEHCGWVMDQGSHYVAPFGTTGEALSFGLRARMAALEGLVAAGIAPDRMLPGTGLTSLEDTVALTRHAVGLGCAGTLTLPPFFFPFASEEGLFRYFAALIEAVGSPKLRLCLYHIPQYAGVGFTAALAARLNRAFPETVVALKDSTGSWDSTRGFLEAAPDLAVFPGSEAYLEQALAAGAAGCISATGNIASHLLRGVFDGGGDAAEMNRVRAAIAEAGLIESIRWLVADATGEPAFLRPLLPLLPLDDAGGRALKAGIGGALAPLASHPSRRGTV